ncbi:MAG: SpoIID/LytB domain-containing protein, partial [bacterium]
MTRLEFSSAGLSLMDVDGNSTALKAMDVRLVPGDSSLPLLLNERPYRGEIRLFLSGGKMDLVNVLNLEDYLCGVLPGELRTSAAEAEKAQAIVARTYAVGKALKNKKRTYDLRATSADQVYGGSGVEDPTCDQAVEGTRGLILAFQGKLAGDVFYHSTCGGSTESAEVVFRGRPVEYLTAVPCTMEDSREELCSFSRYFRWSVEWKKDELDEILKTTLGKSIGHIQTM